MPCGIQGPPYAWFRDDALENASAYVPERDGVTWFDGKRCFVPDDCACSYGVAARATAHADGVSVTGLFSGNPLGHKRMCRAGMYTTAALSGFDGTKDYKSDQHDVIVAREARRFLGNHTNASQPYFLDVAAAAVHLPYTPPAELGGRRILGE